MSKEKPFIKRFQIKELFGIYNVDIPFTDNINIFVGENGLGKTTILNCLNYVLQCDIDNLYNIEFKTIIVTFRNNKKIIINHEELITDSMLDFDFRRRHSILFDSDAKHDAVSVVSLIRKIYKEIKKENSKMDFSQPENILMLSRRLRIKYGIEITRLQLEKTIKEFESKINNDWEEQIQEIIKENIIYLPTYRRIEEDFNKCMNNDYKIRNDIMKKISNMQFGMGDVEQLIKDTCNELKNSTNEGFKEMTSNLLKNYVDILTSKEDNKLNIKIEIEEEKLKIIFSRLADKIDEEVQKAIIRFLFDKSNISEFQYKYLVSIINSLLDIYEKTKKMDEGLNNFVNVCNKYLENNEFIYNPFKVECTLIQQFSDETIAFKNLSSGEKQIVSLFSKIYLSKENNNIILFDEPELSLSIIWQAKLLPDIIASNKCGFMMIITHSPFIFDNDFKTNTRDIKNYITPIRHKTIYA